MPAFTFDKILEKGAALGKLPAKERKSRDWFRTQARKTSITPRKLQSEAKSQAVGRVSMGRMYFFAYDPKTKKELPYYDRFPLIFPFKKAQGGFMGINLHYLPPRLRAKLMDALYGLVTNKKYDETKMNTEGKVAFVQLNNISNRDAQLNMEKENLKVLAEHYTNILKNNLPEEEKEEAQSKQD